jgi:hypothetical protein
MENERAGRPAGVIYIEVPAANLADAEKLLEIIRMLCQPGGISRVSGLFRAARDYERAVTVNGGAGDPLTDLAAAACGFIRGVRRAIEKTGN